MKKFVAVLLHVLSVVILVMVSTIISKNVETTYNLCVLIIQLFVICCFYFDYENTEVYWRKLMYSGWLVLVVAVLISVIAILLGASLGGFAFLLAVISFFGFLIF